MVNVYNLLFQLRLTEFSKFDRNNNFLRRSPFRNIIKYTVQDIAIFTLLFSHLVERIVSKLVIEIS